MRQDLRFTVRLIAKERWFSAVIIVALALGIGLNDYRLKAVDSARE